LLPEQLESIGKFSHPRPVGSSQSIKPSLS
jgi:hypothetical protein